MQPDFAEDNNKDEPLDLLESADLEDDEEKAEQEADAEKIAAEKQAQLLNQGRRVNVEGREITVVKKEALLKFIEDNLPSGQNMSGQEVLTIYQKLQRIEAERREAEIRQQEAERARDELARKLAEAEGRIVELNNNIDHLNQRDSDNREKLESYEQRFRQLDSHCNEIGASIQYGVEEIERLTAELEMRDDEIRALREKLSLLTGDDAEKLARIEALEKRERELLELVTRYRRDLSFAAGQRELESSALLEELNQALETATDANADSVKAEVERLIRLVKRHEIEYPRNLNQMNEKAATIDLVVELCQMGREEVLIRRQLKFIKQLLNNAMEAA